MQGSQTVPFNTRFRNSFSWDWVSGIQYSITSPRRCFSFYHNARRRVTESLSKMRASDGDATIWRRRENEKGFAQKAFPRDGLNRFYFEEELEASGNGTGEFSSRTRVAPWRSMAVSVNALAPLCKRTRIEKPPSPRTETA